MTRYSEKFDEDQPELFTDEVIDEALETAASAVRDELLEMSKEMGQRAGEKAVDKIMSEVQESLSKEIPEDIGKKMEELYAESPLRDIIVEEDKWYELTADCCDAYLEGMSLTWPNVISTKSNKS